MKRIVVLGALGMAGHIMVLHLRGAKKYEVLGVARSPGRFVDKPLDVTNFSALEHYLEYVRPDYVINCVGALVSHASKRIASAILLNSYLPHFLADKGKDLGYKLVHISTDCVFSGKEGAYTETSFRDGDNNYARSKALGEVINNRDITIRTSIVGPELKVNGTGLFDFFLKQEGKVQGYTKSLWSGITTLELAKAVCSIIADDVCGIYHLTNGKPINKYELLELFNKYTGKGVVVEAIEGYAVDKSLIDTRKELNVTVPDYDIMVSDMVTLMRKYPELYSHYSF